MKKISFFIISSFAVLMTSCSGYSKSGNLPTGPKTFVKGVVLASKKVSDLGSKFLFDSNFDGKADAEKFFRNNTEAPKVNDTVTLVLQQGEIIEWYK